MPIRCKIYSEDSLGDHIYTFSTEAEYQAFSSGVYAGSGLYGCGSCYTVRLDANGEPIEE